MQLNGVSMHSARGIVEAGGVTVENTGWTWLLGLVIDNPNNLTIDLNRQDAFTQAFHDVEQRSMTRLGQSAIINELLKKPHWQRIDREIWEAELSLVVAQEMATDPLLGGYRTGGYLAPATGRLVESQSKINELTVSDEFDCDRMAVVKAILFQRAEAALLPREAGEGNFRREGQYFLASGQVGWPVDSPIPQNSGGGHGWVVSAATGNIIEATDTGPAPYRRAMHPNHTMDQVIAGYPVITQAFEAQMGPPGKPSLQLRKRPDGSSIPDIYNSGFRGNAKDQDMASKRYDAVQSGDFLRLDSLSNQIDSLDMAGYNAARLHWVGQMIRGNTAGLPSLDVLLAHDFMLPDGMVAKVVSEQKEVWTEEQARRAGEMRTVWNEAVAVHSALGSVIDPNELKRLRTAAREIGIAIYENDQQISNGIASPLTLVIRDGRAALYEMDGKIPRKGNTLESIVSQAGVSTRQATIDEIGDSIDPSSNQRSPINSLLVFGGGFTAGGVAGAIVGGVAIIPMGSGALAVGVSAFGVDALIGARDPAQRERDESARRLLAKLPENDHDIARIPSPHLRALAEFNLELNQMRVELAANKDNAGLQKRVEQFDRRVREMASSQIFEAASYGEGDGVGLLVAQVNAPRAQTTNVAPVPAGLSSGAAHSALNAGATVTSQLADTAGRPSGNEMQQLSNVAGQQVQ